MPRLIVHIGVHKTGTSAIQNAMRQSIPALRDEGIAYWQRTGFFGPNLDPREPLPDSDFEREAVRVRKMIAADDAMHAFVVSYEGLAGELRDGYATAHERARRLRMLTEGIDVSILAYVRRQDLFVESAYAQLIQEGESLGFQEYLDSLSDTAFSWKDLLDAYAHWFGDDSVTARIYERQRLEAQGGLLADFCDAIGATSLSPGDEKQVNRSYNRDALEVARAANDFLDTDQVRSLRRLLQAASARQPREPLRLFSHGERAAFVDRYSTGNVAVARMYTDGGTESLFSEPTESESASLEYPGLGPDAVAKTLALAMLSLDELQPPEPHLVRLARRVERGTSRVLRRLPRLRRLVHRARRDL